MDKTVTLSEKEAKVLLRFLNSESYPEDDKALREIVKKLQRELGTK